MTNMKLEQQVCSLELAKQLKKLGVPQKGYFNWWQRIREDGDGWEWYVRTGGVIGESCYCAFTVAELGEILPKKISEDGRDYKLAVGFRETGEIFRPYCEYWNPYEGKRDFRIGDGRTSDTEADARTTMLTYLLENKLITLQ